MSLLKKRKACRLDICFTLKFKVDTFEVRIFPVWLDGQRIVEAAGLFEGILYWAINSPKNAILPPNMQALLNELSLSTELRDNWQKRWCDVSI